MGWLVGYTLASIVVAFIVLKIFDYIVGGATSGLLSVARAGLFIVTWSAVTTQAGMHGFSKRIQGLRKGIAVMNKP